VRRISIKELVPEILVHIWMGHSNKNMQQRYSRSGVRIDSLFRTITAQKVGLGFQLPDLRPVAPTLTDAKSLERWCARRDSNSRPSGS
jgi:hypothetical protein